MSLLRRSSSAAPNASPRARALARIEALRNRARFPQAQRFAEAEVAKRPEDAHARTALGLVHLHAGRPAEALLSLRQALRLAPLAAACHRNLAAALEMLGRDDEAITALRQAVALAPADPDALERLGNLLLTYGRREEAIACLRRAAAALPDTLSGRLNAAKADAAEGRTEEAEAHLRATIRLYPKSGEAHRFLATILSERGSFEQAIPLLEQATAGSPTEAASAYYDLAMAKRAGPGDGRMLEQMGALLRLDALPIRHRVRLYFGLGKAADDMGRYEEAMRHFDAANRLARQGMSFDRARFVLGVERLIASFTAEAFVRDRASGSASETPVLILGMPRSGTTLVEQIISSHTEVGAGGELDFWSRQAETVARYPGEDLALQTRRIASEYEALLQRIACGARRVTDKLPGNFLWLGLIHRAFPRARIIHCRRHPVDTCLSNYFTNFTVPMPFSNDKGNLVFYYRCYERLMAHWRAVLPAHSLMEVPYEELVTDPEPLTRRMVEFIGLSWDEACLTPEANRGTVKTASMWQVRQKTYRSSVERWRRYEPWLGELRQLLGPVGASSPRRPDGVMAMLQRASSLRDGGKPDAAAWVLSEAARLSPNDALIENEVGLIHLRRHAWRQAAESFARAIALEPDFAIGHYNLGSALERCREPEAAIAAYRRALAHAPDLAAAHARLGNLLHARARREEALAAFRSAAAAAPGSTIGRLSEAKVLLEEGRSAEAETLLRKITAADPASSEAERLLGNVLCESGRFAEAASSLERALTRDPAQVAAWFDLAHTRRMSAADRTLIRRMEARLRDDDLTDFDCAVLHFALGKCWDDLGLAAEAMAHFDAGNRLEKAGPAFDRAGLAAGIERLIALFTLETMRASAGDPSVRPLLVLGMPRSGTTLVEQILSSHPEIGGGGELGFWSEHLAAITAESLAPERLRAMGADYLGRLDRMAPLRARVTDKNPFNFLAIGLIHLALPGARFIHCRRDPIDTCLSIYFTRFATRQDFACDRGDIAFYYRQYERLMAHWRKVLQEGRLIEIDYETLVADPEPEARRLIGFCGLEWNDACARPERNPRIVRTASMWQVRQPVYRDRVARWRRYEPWLGELRELLAGDI
ncbi:MAG: sulfotransferase [Acetobacteraceae bacterium]